MEECQFCKNNHGLGLICPNEDCRESFIKSMRGMTKEESEAHAKAVKKLSTPTGRKLYDI